MQSFKDTKGNTWEIQVNVGTIRRVRNLAKLDLPGLFANKMEGLADLLGDLSKVVDVVYVLCKSQADEKGVTDEEFGYAFDGEVLEAATQALLEELANFFRDGKTNKKSEAIKKALSKMKALGAILVEEGTKRIEAADVQKEADAILKTLDASLTNSSGAAPVLSASTPIPSHSES